MRNGELCDELENMQIRMYQVLDQLQEVHAKLASTAITADRVLSRMNADDSVIKWS
jgi:hypothetical protein